MIRSFRCRETQAIFERAGSRRFRALEEAALRRLRTLDAATSLLDLAAIRSNHLEALRAERKGQHSIRINAQWRICFVWTPQGPEHVEIVDYH
jgi:proteic killer suppression protein